MADRTSIEWTDATWNPVRGCSRVSEGCRHCYAEGIAARFSGPGQPFEGFADRHKAGSAWTGAVDLAPGWADAPIAWRTPRRVFVNSMSDLFHENLHQDSIALVYGVAIAAVHLRGHTFQILTKRAKRMRKVLRNPEFWDLANAHASAVVLEHVDPNDRRTTDARATLREYSPRMPPPGIHLGVSVENQDAADNRIPHLLYTPAALRFLSCEPLLEPLHLRKIDIGGHFEIYPLDGTTDCEDDDGQPLPNLPAIGWVIAGGESGTNARPADVEWYRSLRDQCAAAGVPFFMKQMGGPVKARMPAIPDDLMIRQVPNA